MIYVCGRVENIVEKGENACDKHFLFFSPHCFQDSTLLGSLKIIIVKYRVKCRSFLHTVLKHVGKRKMMLVNRCQKKKNNAGNW